MIRPDPRALAPLAFALLALASTGCRRPFSSIPMKGKLIEVKPDGIVVEATATPGARVGIGTTLKEGDGVVADAGGKARLTLGRDQWKHMDGANVQLVAEKNSTFSRSAGHTDVAVGAPLKALTRVPADAEIWFVVVGGSDGIAGKEDPIVELDGGDAPIRAWVASDEGTLSFRVAATPGAEVDLAGKTYEIEKTGISLLEIAARDLWLGVRSDTLTGNKLRSELAYEVRSGKQGSEGGVLKVSLDSRRGLAELMKQLRGVAKQKPFPDRAGKVVDTVVHVTYQDTLLAVGPDTTIGRARWVALETDTLREGGKCVYDLFTRTRKYHDVEVKVFEARTGKEVASKKFALDEEVECPQFATSSQSFDWREKVENVTAWLEKASKSGWK